MAGSGLCGHAPEPLLFGIIGLGNGRVQFMAAAGIVALELVVNLCRRAQLFLQAVGTYQGRWAVHFIKIADFLRDLKKGRVLVQLLGNQLLTEHTGQLFCLHGLVRSRVQQRRRLLFHVGPQVIPGFGHLVFIQVDLIRDFFVFHCHYLHMIFIYLIAVSYCDIGNPKEFPISQKNAPDREILSVKDEFVLIPITQSAVPP